jgi:hypothetical protein
MTDLAVAPATFATETALAEFQRASDAFTRHQEQRAPVLARFMQASVDWDAWKRRDSELHDALSATETALAEALRQPSAPKPAPVVSIVWAALEAAPAFVQADAGADPTEPAPGGEP